MGYQTLRYQRHGPVGVLTLHRPDKLNSLTRQMFAELNEFCLDRWAEADCRALVIHGAGRAFCAGADIAEMEGDSNRDPEGSAPELYRRESRIHDLVLLMRRIPQPLIAAVHGWAAGGGFSLALACDVLVIDPTAKFVASFINVGLSGGDMGASIHLPHRISRGLAHEILMTGQAIGAKQAERIGLANHLVTENTQLQKALEIADSIAMRPLSVLTTIKRALNTNCETT